ncbi:hypothetical protein Y032_0015g2794 [Ancylostoma ceylanicum]|uniref:Ground-like domain-containing protein n=1 Tax=Ancylostoma ceylanicum TaxID=53326 RepID=A0A016V8D9_9BILA|nr:hypothetical protein Y032_0015g2794 [Ancylostoma ceylanicum]
MTTHPNSIHALFHVICKDRRKTHPKRHSRVLDMLTGLFRYLLCLIVVIQLVHPNFNDNCTSSSCHDRTNTTAKLTIGRTKRAAPAQCSSSSDDVAHSLVSSVCCDSMIPLFIDNQLSTTDGIGAITRAVQQRVQSQFNRSFEVIISESDFVVNTYYSGPRQCKFETDRYFVALYETPVQYDLADTATENFVASIDSRDPLGWKQAPLAEDNEALPVEGTAGTESQLTAPSSAEGAFAIGGPEEGGPAEAGPAAALPAAAGPAVGGPAVGGPAAAGPAAAGSAAGAAAGVAQPSQAGQAGSGGVCSWRSGAADPNIPYVFSADECCDARLNTIMRDAAARSRDTPHLGDSAKYIQRRIQLEYGLSFEVMMSRGDFAVSSYYHGPSNCKINDGVFHYVAYATPVQYDPFNIAQEDYLASTDAEEPLGSTRYTNLRGDRPDIRVEPSAGEDISIQPAILAARASLYEGAGGAGRTANREPGAPTSGFFPEDASLLTASAIDGFHVGGNRSLGTVISQEGGDLPPGTHCDKEDRTGDKCCSGLLFETMTDAFYELSSSPQFAFTSAGNIASLIQKRAQLRFDQSFEVIVSPGDFALASHGFGDQTCKYKERGFTAIAYATPRQDNGHFTRLYKFTERELELVSLLDRIAPIHEQTIQFNVEEQLQMSFETIVSTDDFAFSSDYSGNDVCKYRIDRYYVMTYATPVQYPIHSQFYEDSGPAIPINCPAELDALDGAVCCDGTLQYEMTRAIDEAIINQPEGQRNSDALARTISRNIQRRFGTTFETIVSRSDFTWQTHIYNENTCKIDTRGYHTLTVESSKAPIQSAMGQPPVPPQFPPPQGPFPPAFVGPPAAAPPVAAPPVAAPPVAAPPVAAPPVAAPPVVPPAFAPPPVVPGFGGGAGAGAGGGGGGGGACFSTDTWVTTPNGKKRMDQLKVGDFVLTANLTTAYFAPMSLWIHREPDVITKFVTIMTDYGKMLALTPRHLIFRNKCDEYYDDRVDSLPSNSQAVYADELKVGDCVYLLYRNGFRQQKLQDISITQRRGIFSPLTPNGRIIVNDMLASCYSDVNEATLQTTYFSVDLPFGSEFSMELLRLIVPYVK